MATLLVAVLSNSINDSMEPSQCDACTTIACANTIPNIRTSIDRIKVNLCGASNGVRFFYISPSPAQIHINFNLNAQNL